MKFEQHILDASEIRQKNLLLPAKQAFEHPDTGVKILKKSAYYVIKDCASIALNYTVHLAYSSLSDPLNQLKGKFTKEDIQDFVDRSKQEAHTNQLLSLIFADINKIAPPKVTVNVDRGPKFNFNNEDEPYGDYDYDGYLDPDDYVESDPEVIIEKIDMNDSSKIVKMLVQTFSPLSTPPTSS